MEKTFFWGEEKKKEKEKEKKRFKNSTNALHWAPHKYGFLVLLLFFSFIFFFAGFHALMRLVYANHFFYPFPN